MLYSHVRALAAHSHQTVYFNILLLFHPVVGERAMMLCAHFTMVHCAQLHVIVELRVALCELEAYNLQGVVHAICRSHRIIHGWALHCVQLPLFTKVSLSFTQ